MYKAHLREVTSDSDCFTIGMLTKHLQKHNLKAQAYVELCISSISVWNEQASLRMLKYGMWKLIHTWASWRRSTQYSAERPWQPRNWLSYPTPQLRLGSIRVQEIAAVSLLSAVVYVLWHAEARNFWFVTQYATQVLTMFMQTGRLGINNISRVCSARWD